MNYVALGKRIRTERMAKKWTQARLAKEIGLSVSFLGHVERGSRKASLETLVGISNTLQVSLEYLLSDSLITHPQTDLYDSLTPRQRKALREIVQQIGKDLDDWAGDASFIEP